MGLSTTNLIFWIPLFLSIIISDHYLMKLVKDVYCHDGSVAHVMNSMQSFFIFVNKILYIGKRKGNWCSSYLLLLLFELPLPFLVLSHSLSLSLFFLFFFSFSFLVSLLAPNEVHGVALVFGRVHGTFYSCQRILFSSLLSLICYDTKWKKHKKNNKHKTTCNILSTE